MEWPAGTAPAEIAALYERLADYALSENLEQLSQCGRFRVLSGKLAVIHLDGNGFGKLQDSHCGSDEEQIRFDRRVRGRRAEALAHALRGFVPGTGGEAPLLEAVIPAAEAKQQRPVLRLETLLWGGDEMTLVVPAWLGFEVLLQLFASLGDEAGDDDSTAMTHAAGIVFCHANTPIARMRELAQRLCDSVKVRFDPSKPAPNGFDYVVLESIDYPVEKTIDAFFETRYATENAANRTALAPSTRWCDSLRPALERLIGAEVLARSQVYRLARHIRFDDHRTLFGNQAAGALPWSKVSDAAAATVSEPRPSPFEQYKSEKTCYVDVKRRVQKTGRHLSLWVRRHFSPCPGPDINAAYKGIPRKQRGRWNPPRIEDAALLRPARSSHFTYHLTVNNRPPPAPLSVMSVTSSSYCTPPLVPLLLAAWTSLSAMPGET